MFTYSRTMSRLPIRNKNIAPAGRLLPGAITRCTQTSACIGEATLAESIECAKSSEGCRGVGQHRILGMPRKTAYFLVSDRLPGIDSLTLPGERSDCGAGVSTCLGGLQNPRVDRDQRFDGRRNHLLHDGRKHTDNSLGTIYGPHLAQYSAVVEF